jgi:origin recognition complex subunit 4
MPVKRKYANDKVEPPCKRRTRSGGPLAETPCDYLPSFALQREAIKAEQANKAKSISSKATMRQSYLKGHRFENSAEPSEDELNLSPSRLSRSSPKRVTTRAFLDCVEIPRRSRGTPAASPHEQAAAMVSINSMRNPVTTYKSRHRRKTATSQVETSSDSASEISSKASSLDTNLTTPTASPSMRSNNSPSKTASASAKLTASHSKQSIVTTPVRATMAIDPSPSRTTSPLKKSARTSVPRLPTLSTPQASSNLPHTLPPHLHSCLNAQKRLILRSLRELDNAGGVEDNTIDIDVDVDSVPTNAVAHEQLRDLLNGTVARGEGNSCLLLGPRGSGKTRVTRFTHFCNIQ